MYWYHTIGVLALVLLLAMIGLSGLSYAQGTGGLTDFRDKSSYSADDLAQALFAEPDCTGTYAWRGAGEGPSVIALTPSPQWRSMCCSRRIQTRFRPHPMRRWTSSAR